ncbi:MAG TPA: hypothetical protein VET24_13355 [Actinomycetota bacterium]|nr:hypothetical protein [Actinomycetota bacterium]
MTERSIALQPLHSEPLQTGMPAGHLDEVFGEGLSMDERLVVSPCEGALRDRRAREGDYVCAGDVVARVRGTDGELVPVHSPFAGWVMGFLVPHGSPVRRREPVLWLRRL